MDDSLRSRLDENLRRVRARIQAACERSRRSPDDVALIAVTKYASFDAVRHLVELGQADIGESRVQELTRRAAMLAETAQETRPDAGPLPPPRWHMVGHLQRNKVKGVLPWIELIHSVDSLRLAEEINGQAGRLSHRVPILLQINVSGERSKFGLAVGAAAHLVEQIVTLPHLSVAGLMTMAPYSEDERLVRNCFGRLRELREDIQHERFAPRQFRHLSMGMSHDFELAIEEGATMVRIGSALFEGIEPVPAPAPE